MSDRFNIKGVGLECIPEAVALFNGQACVTTIAGTPAVSTITSTTVVEVGGATGVKHSPIGGIYSSVTSRTQTFYQWLVEVPAPGGFLAYYRMWKGLPMMAGDIEYQRKGTPKINFAIEGYIDRSVALSVTAGATTGHYGKIQNNLA